MNTVSGSSPAAALARRRLAPLSLLLATLRFPVLRLPTVAPSWWRPTAFGLFLIAQAGNLGDLLTTLAGLRLAADEGGRFLAWLIGTRASPVASVLAVRSAYALLILGLWLVARTSWATERGQAIAVVGIFVLLGLATAFAWATVHNLRAILWLTARL